MPLSVSKSSKKVTAKRLSEMEGGDGDGGDGGGARSHGGDMNVKSTEFMDELRKRMVDTRRRGYKELQKKAEERKRQLEEIKEKEREREEDDRRRRERKEKRQREEQEEEEKKRRKIQEKGKQKVNEHLGTEKEQWRGDAPFRPMPTKVKPKIAIIETVKPPGQSEAHARRRRTQQALAQQKTLHAGFRQQNTPIASSEAAEATARWLPMDIDTTTRRGSVAPSSASARGGGGGGGGGASGAVMRVQQRSNFAPSTSTQNQIKVALRLPASYGLAEYKNLEHAVLSARLLRDDDEETVGDANERPITASVGPSPNEFAHAQAYTKNFMPLLMDEGRAVRFLPPLSSQRYTNAIKHTRTPVSSYRPLFFLTRSVVRILCARACRALLRVWTRSRVCVYTHTLCRAFGEKQLWRMFVQSAGRRVVWWMCVCTNSHCTRTTSTLLPM